MYISMNATQTKGDQPMTIKDMLKKADIDVIKAIDLLEIAAAQARNEREWSTAETATYIARTLRNTRGEGEPGTGLAGLVAVA